MTEHRRRPILVVDDRVTNRYVVTRILEEAGYPILEASTGMEALRLARQAPALVVLDVHLPDINDFEVCTRLKADPKTASIPVLHLSASFVSPEAQAHGLNAGADGYLTHPIEPPVLTATVQALLRTREAEQALRAKEAELRAQAAELQAANRELAEQTAQTQALAERLARLQAVTAQLAGALTVEQIAAVVLTQVLPTLGAEGGALYVMHERDTLRLAHHQGYPAAAMPGWDRPLALDERLPVCHSVRTGEPLVLPDLDAWRRTFPEFAELHRQAGYEGAAILPCRSHERVEGAISLSFREACHFGSAEWELAEAVTQQCAQALQRVRLFEAERRVRAEAEAANLAKMQFLTMMSHELRTPLNAIAGYADLLDLGIHGPVSDAQREALLRIKRSQEHLLGLINDVLNFAKLEAGQVQFSESVFAVREVLADALALIEPQRRAKNLALSYELCSPRTRLRADREKVEQVVLNLLTNAVKFTEQGSVTLVCETQGESVLLHVRDTGIGIPAEKRAAIFEPFVQVDHRLTRTAHGTGLGLAISRDLARAMGGELSVESEEGVGSTFTLRLPGAREEGEPPGEVAARVPA